MNANNALTIDQQLCFALYSTSLAVTRQYKSLLDASGLTYTQYLMLLVLWESDGLTLRALATRLHQDSGALTPVLKRLEAEGYVHRRRDPQDERNLSITLTDAGRALQSMGRDLHDHMLQACGLTEDQSSALREQLAHVRRRLTKHSQPE